MNDAEMLERVAVEVRGFVERKFAPLMAEVTRLRDMLEQQTAQHVREMGELRQGIAAIELKPGPAGKDGSNGRDGKDGANGIDGKDGAAGRDGKDADIDAIITTVLELMPKPERGEKGDAGRDGKDAAPVDTAALISQVLALLPKPERGEKGEPGRDGKDAIADHDQIAAKVLALVPVPRDGRDGKDGKDGQKGDKGEDGRDGKGISRIEHDKSAHTLDIVLDGGEVYTLNMPMPERGEKGERGPRGETGADGMDGRDGADGRNGKDGLQLDDFAASIKDGRTLAITMTLSDGSIATKELPLRGMVLDKGIYKAGTSYEHGDSVTYAGSYWIAQRATEASPGNGSSDWRLAVKRGRDGKDAGADE